MAVCAPIRVMLRWLSMRSRTNDSHREYKSVGSLLTATIRFPKMDGNGLHLTPLGYIPIRLKYTTPRWDCPVPGFPQPSSGTSWDGERQKVLRCPAFSHRVFLVGPWKSFYTKEGFLLYDQHVLFWKMSYLNVHSCRVTCRNWRAFWIL